MISSIPVHSTYVKLGINHMPSIFSHLATFLLCLIIAVFVVLHDTKVVWFPRLQHSKPDTHANHAHGTSNCYSSYMDLIFCFPFSVGTEVLCTIQRVVHTFVYCNTSESCHDCLIKKSLIKIARIVTCLA